MILGAISPKSDKDRRSTLHPNSIKPLKDMGIEIFFERGLGEGIDVSDEEMKKNGAQPASREDCLSRSDVIFSSEPISSDEIARIKKNAFFFFTTTVSVICDIARVNLYREHRR